MPSGTIFNGATGGFSNELITVGSHSSSVVYLLIVLNGEYTAYSWGGSVSAVFYDEDFNNIGTSSMSGSGTLPYPNAIYMVLTLTATSYSRTYSIS